MAAGGLLLLQCAEREPCHPQTSPWPAPELTSPGSTLCACDCAVAFTCVLCALLDTGFTISTENSYGPSTDFFLLLFSALIGEPDFDTLKAQADYYDTSAIVL